MSSKSLPSGIEQVYRQQLGAFRCSLYEQKIEQKLGSLRWLSGPTHDTVVLRGAGVRFSFFILKWRQDKSPRLAFRLNKPDSGDFPA